jgi:glycosyltransferase involved in cell wall biosynthesis
VRRPPASARSRPIDTPFPVAVDATAVPARLTGAGVYVDGLLRGLGARRDLTVHAFLAPHTPITPAVPGVRVHRVRAAGHGRLARMGWTQAYAGHAAVRVRARVLHGVHYELPLTARVPQVVTIHDLTMVTNPEWHEARRVAWFRWAMSRSLRHAARVLCVSATTARDLATALDVAPDRIDVTPLGTDLAPAGPPAVAAVRARLGLRGRYVLGLGTLEPRKDLPTLVAAFATLAGEIPHDLVLAGLAGWGSGEVAAAVKASGVRDRVRLVGYVPEEDKAALFTGADVFVYPSRYEGFGLPVLEAMACGTPVVTTTGGSLPEVAAGAAALVEPGDRDRLAGAVRRVLTDGETRALLTERGRTRAAELTWTRCAELTAAAYRRAAAGG